MTDVIVKPIKEQHLEEVLANDPAGAVELLAEAMSEASTPYEIRRLSDLASCYLPLRDRHRVVADSGSPVFKIEHMHLLAGPASLGSCVELLDALAIGQLRLDSMLVSHIEFGDHCDRAWPLLAAAGHRYDHRWSRLWSSEQMLLALSLYSHHQSRLSELASATSGGWSPTIFESAKIHTSALKIHIPRALQSCDAAAPHLRTHVLDSLTPEILLGLLATNSLSTTDAVSVIRDYDIEQIRKMLNTPMWPTAIAVLLDTDKFAHLHAVLQDSTALLRILSHVGIENSPGLSDLAAALDTRLTVRERIQVAASLTLESAH